MASCTIPEPYPGIPFDYENVVRLFLKADSLGIYNVHGGDESSVTILRLFCIMLDNYLCPLADFSESDLVKGTFFDPVGIHG